MLLVKAQARPQRSQTSYFTSTVYTRSFLYTDIALQHIDIRKLSILGYTEYLYMNILPCFTNIPARHCW